MLKRAIIVVLGILLVLVGVILVRTIAFKSQQIAVTPVTDIAIDSAVAAQHLSAAIQYGTISFGVPSPISKDAFEEFHAYLENTYPITHTALKREKSAGLVCCTAGWAATHR